MSSYDGLRTSVAIALVLLGGAMARAQVLRTGPGPLERQAKPITPENPIPKRVYFVMPTRPADIDLATGRAVVTLRLTLDGAGSVSEIRSGLGGLVTVGNGLAASDAFIEATADAVKQWRYEPPADPPISFDVRIAFAPDGTSSLVMHGGMALLADGATPAPATTASAAVRSAIRALGRGSGPGRRRCPSADQDQERAAGVPTGGDIRTPPGGCDPRGARRARWAHSARARAPLDSDSGPGGAGGRVAVGIRADVAERGRRPRAHDRYRAVHAARVAEALC